MDRTIAAGHPDSHAFHAIRNQADRKTAPYVMAASMLPLQQIFPETPPGHLQVSALINLMCSSPIHWDRWLPATNAIRFQHLFHRLGILI
jgi:hypothetical protein